jgi:glycosyltransferase involved in cell wall biosynthesis
MDTSAREAQLRNRTPTVSVIIPAYNVARYMGEVLASVLAQTFPDFEVIVVNDGSPDTDELEQVIEPYRQHINSIKRQNGGPSAARNTAILHARGDYVAFLDGDDLWLPNYLSEQLKALHENPELDLICADAPLFGDSALAGRSFTQICPSRGAVTFESLLVEDCAVPTSCALARRRSLVDVGLFDENLGASDIDLWLPLAFHGGHIGYRQRVLARHRLHHTGLAASSTRMLQSQIKVLKKTARTLTLSPGQQELLAKEIAKCEAHIDLSGAKQQLLAGEYGEAMDAFARANDFFRSSRLWIVLQLLRRVPNFLRYIYGSLYLRLTGIHRGRNDFDAVRICPRRFGLVSGG